MTPLLIAAFVLGVAGSAHCVGMCGPIALAVPSSGTGWGTRLKSTVILNSGRLATYVLLGAAFGTFGLGLRLAGLQQGVSLVAGCVLLLSVVVPGLLERWNPTGHFALAIGRLRSVLARNLRRTAPEAVFLTGMLNGLLPCGLVYAAAISAAALGTWQLGALFMLLFALGTWPAMIALRMSGHLLGPRSRMVLRKASPVLVAAMAVVLVLRGLELGIPMVSPPAQQAPVTVTACH